MDPQITTQYSGSEIAIIGMSGRFPKARNLNMFWNNLREGIEGISFFSEEELLACGVRKEHVENPNYVKAMGMLEEADYFDADFFGFSAREAEMMDPQHRLFLECAWETLEDAGYNPEVYPGWIGIYAGSGMNHYMLLNLASNQALLEAIGLYQIGVLNDKDFLTTQTAYKLNLRGPCMSIQTACSTSLVAIHVACQGLLTGDCDLALAGGVSISVPLKRGYMYQPQGIVSPDGHCRAFDVQAQGTVRGNGVGIIALKRLADALADGDHIRAIIKGTAINNDGSNKVGFTAPGIEGQAQVIQSALEIAGVHPESIQYVEAHGTGTKLGDPVEIAALSRAFRCATKRRNFCAIGSVKASVGHLDVASGVTGVIKTVLALENRQIPSSPHFEQPNTSIDFENSPFYVNDRLREWTRQETPRRAGVSSFGIGGTNAHVVLEEAPYSRPAETSERQHVFPLSARTEESLDAVAENLARYLQQHPDVPLADVAYTLQIGRKAHRYRRALLAASAQEICCELPAKGRFSIAPASGARVVFMFPGQGSQYPGMGRELYRYERVFSKTVDECCNVLQVQMGLDLKKVLHSTEDAEAENNLRQTFLTQPALFITEYSMAKLWMSWGIKPQAMIGHSLGEYVAACLSGVISISDALQLVAARGKLMQQQQPGAMASFFLSEQELLPLLGDGVDLAAVNGPQSCVISGTEENVAQLELELTRRGFQGYRLATSRAFHSAMMDPLLEQFQSAVEKIALRPPSIPYLSNVTGTWITPGQATSVSYWVKHLRQTVRFAAGIECLLQEPGLLLLEAGPGHTLSRMAEHISGKKTGIFSGIEQKSGDRQSPGALAGKSPGLQIPSGGENPQAGGTSEIRQMLTTLGELWANGAEAWWTQFHEGRSPKRVSLPSYPFQRRRYWMEPGQSQISHDVRNAMEDSVNAPKVRESSAHYSRPPAAPEYLAPKSEVETKVAEMWETLLGVKPIGLEDDFFEFGGHSLLAVQLISSLRQEFHCEITINSIFQAGRLRQIVEMVEKQRKEHSGPLHSIQPAARTRRATRLATGEIVESIASGKN
jgi:acyl transferase domain-containing protein